MDEIEFFYDVGSPYSYLASLRVDEFGAEVGMPVVWRPFLLGAVFKATGTVPPAMNQTKARWMWHDLKGQASMLGAPIALPSSFPTNTLGVQRALVGIAARDGGEVLRRATRSLYQAYWGRGEDVGDPVVRAAALEEAGFDADLVEREAATREVKDALRDQTESAVARGAFGAPILFARGRMYFGSDRFDLIRYDLSRPR